MAQPRRPVEFGERRDAVMPAPRPIEREQAAATPIRTYRRYHRRMDLTSDTWCNRGCQDTHSREQRMRSYTANDAVDAGRGNGYRFHTDRRSVPPLDDVNGFAG